MVLDHWRSEVLLPLRDFSTGFFSSESDIRKVKSSKTTFLTKDDGVQLESMNMCAKSGEGMHPYDD